MPTSPFGSQPRQSDWWASFYSSPEDDTHLLTYPTLSYEGSVHRGDVKWQMAKILAKRITILSIIAQNYGSKAKHRMLNNSIPWGAQ